MPRRAARRVERNELEPEHFGGWIDWAKRQGLELDFNPTFFSHPLAADGFTLSHPRRCDSAVSGSSTAVACRRIGAAMGQALGSPCITNVWIPDGSKDTPDRPPRRRASGCGSRSTTIFAEKLDPRHNLDAVEVKLFGIGSESYVVGSHEFYLGYAIQRDELLCLDCGAFSSDRVDRRQDLGRAHVGRTRFCCTSAAACAGTATTW